ncbi:MAG: helicase associated domain-containing protein [Planctomycetota bacterium]
MKVPIGLTRRQSSWEQRFKELKAFKKRYGHYNVPRNYSPNPTLRYWVNNIRHSKKYGTLAEEKVRRLDALGFFWGHKRDMDLAAVWEQHINNLKAFKKENGHCNVSSKDQNNPALGRWVNGVRQRKNLGKLDDKRIRCLDDLGFCWASRDKIMREAWKQHIHDLKAFKKKFGHCNVPYRYQPSFTLGQWVNGVRQLKKQGKLTKDRILILDALGFSWVIKPPSIQVPWKQHITDLKAFKKEHGNCNVPKRYSLNPAMGQWVSNLRQRKKRGELTEDKIFSLDSLGFSWDRLGKQV